MRHVRRDEKLKRLDTSAQQTVYGKNALGVRALHGTDIARDLLHADVFRTNGAADAAVLAHGGVFRPVHPGDRLRYALHPGVHTDEHIFFVEVRERDNGVHLGDVLTEEEILPCAVGAEDGDVRQTFRKLPAALGVMLDELHAHARFAQQLRERFAQPSAADDHHILRVFFPQPQLVHGARKGRRRRGQIYLVPGPDRKRAVRDERLLPAADGAHEHAVAQDTRQLHELFPAELIIRIDLHRHDLGTGFGKRFPPEKSGQLQLAEDLACGIKIRRDRHGKAQLLPQELHAVEVAAAADAGDRVCAAELARQHAGKDVRLVVRRGGDQKIALRHERGVLHVERGAVSLHGHTVERERKPVAHGAAAVDDRYIVSLGGYLAGNGKADLTSADNHNFHKSSFFSKKRFRGLYGKCSIAFGRADSNRFPSGLTVILRFTEVFGKNLIFFLTECYNVCYNDKAAKNGSIAQLVRAHALQAWGHRFESCCSHHSYDH